METKTDTELKKVEPVKPTSFEDVIMKMSDIEIRQRELATRAQERSMRINGNINPVEANLVERPQTIINIMLDLLDRMDMSNRILSNVVNDLEEVIM